MTLSATECPATSIAAPRRQANRPYGTAPKRALDLVLTLLTAPIWLLVIATCALLVMTDGKSPFYSQDRIGRGGRRFRILKLRTMVADADDKLEAYLRAHPAARTEWQQTQKLKQDPRVTRVGRLLRKSSIDELPQLFNVLLGNMSLVGPRPIWSSRPRSTPVTPITTCARA